MPGGTVWQQFRYLLYRNVLLKLRKPKETLQEVLMPGYFVAILVVLAVFIPNETYPAVAYSPPAVLPANVLPTLPNPLFIGFVPGASADVADVMARVVNGSTSVSTFRTAILRPFDTPEDAETFYLANPGGLHAVVQFLTAEDGTLPRDVQLTFRVNGSFVASTNSVTGSPTLCRQGLTVGCNVGTYITSGLMDLQTAVSESLAQHLLNVSVTISGTAQSYPLPAYTSTSLVLLNITAIYMVIAFSPLVQFLLTNIVLEKEKKIKEGMAMMGLREVSYLLSWFAFYSVLMVVTTIIMTVLAVIWIFPGSSFGVIWLMLVLYGFSMIAYSFALTPFFGNAKVAGVVGSLFTFVISIIYVPLAGTTVQSDPAAKWACSLLSPVALALGMSEAVAKIAAGIPVNAETARVGTQTPGYSISSTILMLIIDIVLYFALAWYLDSVVPTEYGVKRPWYFLFTPSFWTAKAAERERVDMATLPDPEPSDDVERVPAELAARLAVDIRNVRKVYPRPDYLKGSKEKVALADVSLQMYEGQIFGLLGHNGAGKSTLVSILSGLFSATSGSVTAFGLNAFTHMQDLRSMMGVCPQQNILFDELTVREHLVIFAGLKGVPLPEMDGEVSRILGHIDLADSADKRSVTLSGGQKRKLCVGMALIGDPRIILLDEPTAGMDPYSRRKLWDLLQQSKPGRVILITSHFLDEIDILADRKAILSHGKVRCCGSSLFLKNRFGLGYYISVERKDVAPGEQDQYNSEHILETIKKHVPDATVDRFTGSELAIRLPLSEVHAFPAMFETLDASLDRLGLAAYSISMTSLEEVFLSLENDVGDDEKGASTDANRLRNKDHVKRLEAVATVETSSTDQLRVLTYAKMRQILRNPRAYFFVVILPVIFLVVGLIIFITTSSVSNTYADLALTPTLYNSTASNPVPVANNSEGAIDRMLAGLPFATVLAPLDGFYNGLLGSTSEAAFMVNTSAPNSVVHTLYVDPTATHALPAFWGFMSSAALATAAGDAAEPFSIATNIYPLPYTGAIFDVTSYFSILLIGLALSLAPGGFAIEIVKERERKIRHQLNVMGLQPWVYWTASFARDLTLYAIPGVCVMILVPAFQISTFTGVAMVPVVVSILIYMPSMIMFAYNLSFLFSKAETVQAVLPPLANILAVIPYYVVAAVDQSGLRREAEIIHYCILAVNPTYGIMGALHYIYMVRAVASLTKQPVYLEDYFSWDSNVPGTLLMMLGHLLLSIMGLYIIERLSVMRNKAPEAANGEQLTNERTRLLNDAEDGRSTLSRDEDEDVRTERAHVMGKATSDGLVAFDRSNIIAVHGLSKTFPTSASAKPKQVDGETSSAIDCSAMFKSPPKPPTKLAVDNICLGVRPGECFGLLGPNGAGKTTTLSMITGELVPTQGHCVVAQLDTRTHLREAFDKMGYCPQFDALFDDLTVKEHLVVYAAIKGVPRELVPDRAEAFMETLGITEFADKVAKDLSGGTKRKLSFCISMIGSPKVAVLDEPSTGMDPSSRRFMWDVILENVKERAAILTTHSMEEADALCTRIAIMVKGRLRCLGTSSHLKHKYGDGFTLEMKVPTANVDAIKRFMDTTFTRHRLVEEYAGRLTYKIPANAVSVGQVFGALERQKRDALIEEYSFSQTTLEQVFIEFAKQQESVDEADA